MYIITFYMTNRRTIVILTSLLKFNFLSRNYFYKTRKTEGGDKNICPDDHPPCNSVPFNPL